mmetsp:Transcript_128850/g.412579  ORF Transcript_128850/g.412579 Transcript_128850/m.412579 type:complete len:144 (+) Transcript_128850:366-797(+)
MGTRSSSRREAHPRTARSRDRGRLGVVRKKEKAAEPSWQDKATAALRMKEAAKRRAPDGKGDEGKGKDKGKGKGKKGKGKDDTSFTNKESQRPPQPQQTGPNRKERRAEAKGGDAGGQGSESGGPSSKSKASKGEIEWPEEWR